MVELLIFSVNRYFTVDHFEVLTKIDKLRSIVNNQYKRSLIWFALRVPPHYLLKIFDYVCPDS